MANSLAAAQAAFERASEELRAQINRLQRFPEEFEIGTVLVFTKTYNDARYMDGEERTYTYAALRTEAGWHTTANRGQMAGSTLTWPELVDGIGDSPCAIADGFRAVPVVPAGVSEIGTDDDSAPTRADVMKLVSKARRSRTSSKDLTDQLVGLFFGPAAKDEG